MIDTRTTGQDASAARRVLIYSYDTFGLGHLRRARTIAHAVVEADPDCEAVILSGSPVIERFALAERVTAVRIPAVTKRVDGAYASLEPGVALEQTVAGREAVIARTAARMSPDLMIVDKEPAGFHGELLPTLERLRAQGCRLVLGLRDILDDAERLVPEWERKGAAQALRRFYDEVWVYGTARIHRPLAALHPDAEIERRLIYTGYLRREVPEARPDSADPAVTDSPFILVTPGGGGDGAGLIDWVIRAYESDPGIPLPALIAFGPFLDDEARAGFRARIAALPGRLSAITFEPEIERLMAKAAGIVAMGGYNTFCEVLSLDKRALLVPRTEPRLEQRIRALAADGLGLARALLEEDGRGAARMAAALKALPDQPLPSRIRLPGLLDGLDVIVGRVQALTNPAGVERTRRVGP